MAGIYIHVPFCKLKCSYCDFYSIARSDMAVPWAEAVIAEFAARRDELGGEAIKTIYFGGGTPSLLDGKLLRDIAETLPRGDVEEFTIEANPDDVTDSKTAEWLACGVNRVSLGVQSLVESELQAVRRRHDAATALRAIDTIHRAGIANISADLIYGLPGQTPDSFRQSLEELLATGITHLSAYCLSFEEGTLLWRQREEGRVAEATDETIEEMYGILCRTAAEADFGHYEISNFALPGKESRHNSAYWDGTPYLGLGPGAHSLGADGMRRYNDADVRAYIADPASTLHVDPETAADRINDMIMISLRTAKGLDINSIPEAHGVRKEVMTAVEKHLRLGNLEGTAEGRMRIKEQRWLLADAVIRDIMV